MSSSTVMGYSGPISHGQQGGIGFGTVRRNPLSTVVSNQVNLGAGEVMAATQALGLPQWNSLNVAQQRMVAARILQARGDPLSKQQAGQILISNPAFQVFNIIYGAAGL